MALQYQSGTVTRDTDNDESVTYNAPASLAAGDLWVGIVSADADAGAGQPGIPTNHSAVDAGLLDATDGTYTRAFYKVAAGGDGNATSTAVSGNWYEVVTASIRFTGAHASAPIGNITNTNPGTGGANIDSGAVTIATTGNAAICWLAGSGSIAPISAPSNMTSIGVNETSWPAFGVAYAESLTAGSFNPNAWTNTNADPAYTQIFEIVQAAGGASNTNITPTVAGPAITGVAPRNDRGVFTRSAIRET